MSRAITTPLELDFDELAISDEFKEKLAEKLGELEVEVLYTYGDPGKLYGLPENCYPPTPAEWELEVDPHFIALDSLNKVKEHFTLHELICILPHLEELIRKTTSAENFDEAVTNLAEAEPDEDC